MDELAKASSEPIQSPHPQLFQALDALAESLLVDGHGEGDGVPAPPSGADRERLDHLVRGVEHTLAKSPPWPLLNEIHSLVAPIASSVRRTTPERFVTLKAAHTLRVHVWSAHEQDTFDRVDWTVPDPDYDVWGSLKTRSTGDRLSALRAFWAATDPGCTNKIENLVEGVRVGSGANDVARIGVLQRHPRDRVDVAAQWIAAGIVMGRRELPRSNAELADALSEALSPRFAPGTGAMEEVVVRSFDASLRKQAREQLGGRAFLTLTLMCQEGIRALVRSRYPAEMTRWPLLGRVEFEVGCIDAEHFLLVLRHRDVGEYIGPSWRRPDDSAKYRPPDVLFGGKAAVLTAIDLLSTWFTATHMALGLRPHDGLFVCPLRIQANNSDAIWDSWSPQEREGFELVLEFNIKLHSMLLGVHREQEPIAPPPRLQTWKRLRVSDEGGQVFLDGKPYRLKGVRDADFLRKLIDAKGEPLKGIWLEDVLGERPHRIYARLPRPIRNLIDRPFRGGSGWRLK